MLSLPLGQIIFPLALNTRSRNLPIPNRTRRANGLTIQHQARLTHLAILNPSHMYLLLFILALIITPLILRDTISKIPHQDSDNQHEPKDIDGLQDAEQGRGDRLRDPTLVLLRGPVQLVGADGCEFAAGEEGPDDA